MSLRPMAHELLPRRRRRASAWGQDLAREAWSGRRALKPAREDSQRGPQGAFFRPSVTENLVLVGALKGSFVSLWAPSLLRLIAPVGSALCFKQMKLVWHNDPAVIKSDTIPFENSSMRFELMSALLDGRTPAQNDCAFAPGIQKKPTSEKVASTSGFAARLIKAVQESISDAGCPGSHSRL